MVSELRKIICSEGDPCDNRCASFDWCNKTEQKIIEIIKKCKIEERDFDDYAIGWNRGIDSVINKLKGE